MENTKNTNRPAPSNEKPVLPVIAITTGDPNGVGYEIVLKSVSDPHILEICKPVLYGNLHVLKQHLATLDEDKHNLQIHVIRDISEVKEGKLNLINCYPDNTPLNIGVMTSEGGKASYMALKQACIDLKNGAVSALVTAPINKENIQSEEFHYSGHTDYLTHMFGNGTDSLTVMVSDQMKIALVCNHVPLTKVGSFISTERIVRKLHTLKNSLQQDFTIRQPRIAVLALNPHAGGNGLIGTEEKDVICPAIEKANEENILAFGPYSADSFFGSGKYTHFDAILAMYHDQGIIPFTSLDMNGVNVTAGLDIIRTSPDHGPSYELAGKNKASAESFAHSLYMAIDMIKRREQYKELTNNPLPIKEPQPEKREHREFKGFNPAEAKRERLEREQAEREAREAGY
ncbi:MAG: 4-hydroxythreonine-4-phosphate dehydrogenase PdxA [Paludibacteraceae bacterium]|nr:4-hydroxythreonine-4-phosphate dehydrogenase PdxA [Paludibacteraceae bacterium]